MAMTCEQTKPTPDDDGWSAQPFWPRAAVIEMNLAFAYAMIHARKTGGERKENITYGAIKDDTPFTPMAFYRATLHSGMTSSAAMCADSGDCGHLVGARIGNT